MLPILVVVCVAMPFVELAVLVWLLDWARGLVGWPGDVLVVAAFVGLSLLGVHLLRRESWVPLQRAREAIWRRAVPPRSQVGDALRVTAAFLMALPGFVSGTLGLLLRWGPVPDVAASLFVAAVSARQGAAVRRARRPSTHPTQAFLPTRTSFPATSGAPLTTGFDEEPAPLGDSDAEDLDWQSASVAGSTVDGLDRNVMEESFFDESDDDLGGWEVFAGRDDMEAETEGGWWHRNRRGRSEREDAEQ